MESSDDDDYGPKPEAVEVQNNKKRKVAFERTYLGQLPTAGMYEKSYMHRDAVTHTLVATKQEFIITASKDGRVKFWKKNPGGIYFVKNYKAHMEAVTSLSLSQDELRLCSTALDKGIKFYDVAGFDMINMIKVEYVPYQSVWISRLGAARNLVAVSDKENPGIRIYHDESDSTKPLAEVSVHTAPVTCMAYNQRYHCVVSADSKGIIEYWNCEDFSSTVPGVKFEYKMDTDLFELCKAKTKPTWISVSKQGDKFVVSSSDAIVRVFSFSKGKMKRAYDESFGKLEKRFKQGETFGLDAIDFGRRVAMERKYLASLNDVPPSNAIFDDSGTFVLLPTLLGIKVVNVVTNKTARILGRVESGERFVAISLYQGTPKKDHQMQHALGGANKNTIKDRENSESDKNDPTIVCAAYEKERFYLFTKREPLADQGAQSEGRDVFNEKPTKSSGGTKTQIQKVLPREATIHTSFGDIVVKLFPDECPRTVENFTGLAQSGYYDNVIFHRVIKDFMIQTGDPLGDGTGGESIWGGEFEDEIHRNLRHDRPYTLSMANAGPNTNGSQFFITTQPTPWLDNKHTVFGRVTKGEQTVKKIEAVSTDDGDRPVKPIHILNIKAALKS